MKSERGGVTACGSFVVGLFRSGTLTDTPADTTASMDSSHHVFLVSTSTGEPPRCTHSMWLLDLRSPRSDAQCRGGDRHGAFIQTQGNCMSVRSLGFNMGFTQPLEPLF